MECIIENYIYIIQKNKCFTVWLYPSYPGFMIFVIPAAPSHSCQPAQLYYATHPSCRLLTNLQIKHVYLSIKFSNSFEFGS